MRFLGLIAFSLFLAGCTMLGDTRAPTQTDFARVRPGMTRDDTLRLLGKPVQTMPFSLSGNESWDYLFQDTWGYMAMFSVTFGPRGEVVGTIAQRLNDGGDYGK